MFKVRFGDGEPEDVATLRLAWRAINDRYAGLGPEETLTWSVESFDGSLQRERLTHREWQARFGGPLAFSRYLEGRVWLDRAGS